MVSIVDDDPSVRDATHGLLRALGYEAAAFASAEEFLVSERLTDTDCLITDVQMPGVDGVELQRRLLDQGHRMPIIFITGCPEEPVRSHVLAAGAFAYLSKPCCPKSLIDCVETALNRGSSRP